MSIASSLVDVKFCQNQMLFVEVTQM